jgi:putative drug exporter of the RND superfamily
MTEVEGLACPDATLKTIAFGLGVSLLVDAFVVRMTLAPAVLALLGRKSGWLPRRPGRRGII